MECFFKELLLKRKRSSHAQHCIWNALHLIIGEFFLSPVRIYEFNARLPLPPPPFVLAVDALFCVNLLRRPARTHQKKKVGLNNPDVGEIDRVRESAKKETRTLRGSIRL